MSLISTESSLLGTAFNKPPSLVFPSLHSNSRTNEPKYSSKEAPNLNSNNNNNEDHSANNKNLQSCIHYASRLIKLRSELRSPSYMNRSNSISESGGDAAGQLFYKSNCTTFGSGRNGRNSSLYELSSTHKSSILDHKSSSSSSNSSTGHSPSLLSDIGRAQSLPNVTQQQDLYHYDKEDESEIFCHHHHHHNKMVAATAALPKAAEIENDDEQDDEASQLTYLSVLVRASLRRRQTHFHEASDHLALPPRHHFHHAPNKEQRPRSISLRDMINEAIDEAIQSTSANDNTAADKPTVLRNSQSFTLASQLLFHASQNSSSSQQQRQKTDQEKKGQEQQQQQQQTHQEQEKENLFLDTTNVKSAFAMTNDKFKEVIPADIHHGVFDEKVEISSQATARRATSTSSNTSTFRQCNKQAKTTATTRAAPMPQPSKSRDNKSLFSFSSSDSELDDEDDDDNDTKTSLSIHSFNKRIIQKRRLQKRPQAFLVSISPSSAAAASVARSRRSKTKQAIRAHHHLNSLLH